MAHLSGRKERFRVVAASETASRKDWRPLGVQLMRTRLSA